MGVWKGKGLEVKRSRGLDAKPCGHLNVYVSGRLDVHHPCDPPCRGGLAVVIVTGKQKRAEIGRAHV